MKWVLGSLLFLILAVTIIINTHWGQNFIISQVTNKLSKNLNTEISIRYVSFSLFNKMNLEGLLVEDRKKDTLMFAGKVQVRITDWFFFKKKTELKYIGIEDALVKIHRPDSVWNYQFLSDYFSGGSSSGKEEGMAIDLKKVHFKNLTLLKKDAWMGEDMLLQLGQMELDAKEINFKTQKIDINNIIVNTPLFHVKNYSRKKPKTINDPDQETDFKTDSSLRWNINGWLLNAKNLEIKNGTFRTDKEDGKPRLDYFDGKHIDFSSINLTLKNIHLVNDTISALLNLSTKERSGFEVKSMTAATRFTPGDMTFENLEIKTNNSIIRNYFSMSYRDMSDFAYYINRVRMNAVFTEAEIDSDDIAFFAPALKTWKKRIIISGNPRGTVDDLFGEDMIIQAGRNTLLNGDFSLSGLPDINQTFIDFKANNLRTTYADAITFFPFLRKVNQPDISQIRNLHFTGSFTGFIRDFVTYGTIRTNLGILTTDLNMKLPVGKAPFYSGKIASSKFELGRLLNDSRIGFISFNGTVKGMGIKWKTLNAELDGTVNQLVFNNYHYENIRAKGTLNSRIFNGDFSIDDSNAVASLTGLVDFNQEAPRYDFSASIGKMNFRKLNLLKENYTFNGDLLFNFSGNNPDDFTGTARIRNATITKNGETLPFDSLYISSGYLDNKKYLTLRSNELEGTVTGNYQLRELPVAFQHFLHNYYPAYVKKPQTVLQNQSFEFNIKTGYITDLVSLYDSSFSGFNSSEISGNLNTIENTVNVNAQVPGFKFKDYQFGNISIAGSGNLEVLNVKGVIEEVQINDSIGFPLTELTISSKNDISQISIQTTGNNRNVAGGSIKASVQTFHDGISILFDSSRFIVNGKTWTIDKDGEMDFRSGTVSNGLLVLRESNQAVHIKTIPSDIGTWNDVSIDMQNFNLGDVAPYFVKSNRIEGLLTGNITIEDPLNRMTVVADLKGEQLWLDRDSIGAAQTRVLYNNTTGKLTANGQNIHPDEKVSFDISLFLKPGDPGKDLISVTSDNYPIKIVERFIGDLFTDLQGYATGKLQIIGDAGSQNFVGKMKLRDGGLKVAFTQCFYKILDSEIEFREDALDLGVLRLLDTTTGNTATLSRGILKHKNWRDMEFDIRADVDNRPMLLLNTSLKDNKSFYGIAKGTGSFRLTGRQSDMRMKIIGAASETDSSYITIPNESSRESGIADFLVERKYGREMSDSLVKNNLTNLSYDVELKSNPLVNIRVVLDELTGDEIWGRGEGNLRINSGSAEPLTIHGRYNINDGNYLFTFQSFFKKPFELKKDAGNYIEWTGDPYHATVKIDAVYKTEKRVDFTQLINSGVSAGSSSGFQDYVYVIAKLRGDLFKPAISFELDFPPESPAKNDLSTSFLIRQLQNNENELTKQVAFLVVFNNFAPTESASSFNISSGVDLFVNSISGILSSKINAVLNNILSNKLNIPGLYVNFSGSLYNPNPFADNNGSLGFDRTNFNFAIAKSILNKRVVLTFEGNADVPLENSTQVRGDILYNFTTEFLINKSGTIRATIFYKENVDYLSGTSTNSNTKSRRFGTSLAYRKEANSIGGLFKRNKSKKKKKEE